MQGFRRKLGWIGCGLWLLLWGAASAACPVENPEGRRRVELQTVLGDICLEMLEDPGEAPDTVVNFLRYVGRGDYDQSFIHRSIPGFVIQGGGFTWTAQEGYGEVPEAPPILNEPGLLNLRGTVAMAKRGGDPDSATSQWFINVGDNPGLDSQNGGFTVFARVVDEDMPVVDAIAGLHTEYGPFAIDDPLAAAFTNLPVLELLERDPDGYGCVIVFPDPPPSGVPQGIDNCMGDDAAFQASIAETIAAMDPQVPERLVLIDRAVPEPAPPLQLGLGALLLGAATLRFRRHGR